MTSSTPWPARLADFCQGEGWVAEGSEIVVGSHELDEGLLDKLAEDVVHLLRLAERRLAPCADGLAERLARLGFSPSEIDAMLWASARSGIADTFARADLLETAAGFKLLELNVGPCVGGLVPASLPFLAGMAHPQAPILKWAELLLEQVGGASVGRMLEDGSYESPFRRRFGAYKRALAVVGLESFGLTRVQDLRFEDRILKDSAALDWIIPVFFPYHTSNASARYAALRQATKAGAVASPVSLVSHALASKANLVHLWQQATSGNCAPTAAALLLETFLLDRESIAIALDSRVSWVLKPANAFGGSGVVIGEEVSDAEWHDALSEALETRSAYVVQELCTPAVRAVTTVRAGGNVRHYPAHIVWGLYVGGGRRLGAPLVRSKPVGATKVINTANGAASGPSGRTGSSL